MTNERYELSLSDIGTINFIANGIDDKLDDLAWESGEFAHLDDEEQMTAVDDRAEAIALQLLKVRVGWQRWVDEGRPHNSPWDSIREAIDLVERGE